MDHVGPLTRSARDAALVMKAIANFDPGDTVPVAGCRIGVPQNFFTVPEHPLRQAEKLGARIVPITVPDPAAINLVARVILLCEASALMQPYLHRRGEFGTDVLALLDQGRLLSATDYVNAQRLRSLYVTRWNAVWEQADVIFTSTTPGEVPLVGQASGQDVRMGATRFVRPFNALGLPAVSIPTNTGVLQIVGRASRDSQIVALAASLALI